jgi:CubicO group peptidase (beta-lactamase class C family)
MIQKLSTLLLFILLYSCKVEQQIEHGKKFLQQNQSFKTTFETKTNQLYDEFNITGDFILGVVNENGLVYSFATNGDIQDGKTSSLDNRSQLYLASHTKAMTGTLLKILADDGILNLGNSLYDYVPELTFAGKIDTKKISIRHLLNHTHGIHSTILTWKTAFLGYNGGNKELIHDLNNNFDYDPSGNFRYSNTGPILAAMVAEKATGKSWKYLMNERIYKPLGMNNTFSNISEANPSRVLPSIKKDKSNAVFQSGFYKKNNTMHAAGGTISTLNDLAKWLQFNIRKDANIVKPSAFSELHNATTKQDRTYFTYKRFAYSLGWDIASYQNDTILTRFGSYGGISFHASFIPSRKIGIIAFSNEDRAGLLPYLMANYAYNLLNPKIDAEAIFLEEKQLFIKDIEEAVNRRMPTEGMRAQQSEKISKLVGKYENNLGWPEISISESKNGYIMNWGVLSGPLYQIPDPERPYLGALGPLMRNFGVQEINGAVDSLFTGSLRYKKIN